MGSSESGGQSSFDRFENYLLKENEGLFIQNTVNAEYTIKQLEEKFGAVSQEEINFYLDEMCNDININPFQKDYLVNSLFYKYFGDPMSLLAIDGLDYIKLLIIGKRILLATNLRVLPFLFASKITKLVPRKKLNKAEREAMHASQYYPLLVNKYQNEKLIEEVEELIATMLSSEFQIIDYHPQPFIEGERNIHGNIVKGSSMAVTILEEMQIFVTLI